METNITSILLVEDEVIIGMMEQKQLESRGYSVHYVTNGETAIFQIAQDPDAYNLVLMDIDLGDGMDGTKAAELILTQKDIPIVFLSSHTEPAIVEKTEKITSYGYVVKHSGIVVLDTSIKMALKLFQLKTEQKHAQLVLKTSEERFHRMLDVIPDMVSIHDPDMNILYSNWNGFAAVPEKKRRIKSKCYATYRNYDKICPDCRAKEVLETGSAITEKIELPEGILIELRVIPILDENNKVEFFVEWVRNLSEHTS